MPDEPVAAQWCFRIPEAPSGGRVELNLEQGIALTVRDPAMLLQILNAEGCEVDFQGRYGLPLLPACRLRRGGDLPGRLRIQVPCSDQKLLRATLKQLTALSEGDRKTVEERPERTEALGDLDVISPRSGRSSVCPGGTAAGEVPRNHT